MSHLQFQVRRQALDSARILTLPDQPLAPGQVRLGIARFAFTANNITYAAFGESMGYWQFFPALEAGDGADGVEGASGDTSAWGCIPVWGFAQVLQSLHPAVAVGERVYGYWPMASHAVLTPTRVTPNGWLDGAAHRAALPVLYNHYLRCSSDPFYSAQSEAEQALLRPLFSTAWLIDDLLADNAWFGAATGEDAPPVTVLLSSASSKTAWATAALLARRPGLRVLGLTSARNRAFCESLGVYHRVLGYGDLDELPADLPAIYVDFAGSAPLRLAVHTRLARLAYSCAVGGTHVAELGGGKDLPGPRPQLFFAPAQAKKRQADWGAAELGQRLLAAWQACLLQIGQARPPWLQVQQHMGPEAVSAAYARVLAGQDDPRTGHMLSLAPGA